MHRIIIVGPNPAAARDFAAKHLGALPRLDGGRVILVWDEVSWEKTRGLGSLPWIALPEAPEHVLKLMYVSFGAPADRLPIETAPKDCRQIMLIGPSGYMAPHDEHQETGHWRKFNDYHWNGKEVVEKETGNGRWENDAGDGMTDGWPDPTHWWPL